MVRNEQIHRCCEVKDDPTDADVCTVTLVQQYKKSLLEAGRDDIVLSWRNLMQ